jgi:hypothetical protein
MPLRRWIVFLVFLLISCASKLLPLIWIALTDPGFPANGGPLAMHFWGRYWILALAEPVIAYGLIRRRVWGLIVGLAYFGIRGVGAAGMTVGTLLGAEAGEQVETLSLCVRLALAVLWSGIALFLYLNWDFFDQ